MRQYYQANINAKPQLEYFLGYSYVHDSASSELWHSKKEKLAFPSLSSSRLVAKRDGSRYLKQVWGGGTVCDVTGKSRTVEIQVLKNLGVCVVVSHLTHQSSFIAAIVNIYLLYKNTPIVCTL